MTALHQSNIKNLALLNQGKVRDIYDIDETYMLIVTTDRLSAFDVILPDAVPDKGAVLTMLSNFWFNKTKHIIANHLSDKPIHAVLTDPAELKLFADCSIVVRKLKPLPIEAVVRGYLIGSGWRDYQQTGSISGVQLPSGLQQAEKLPAVIFTPSTKAGNGEHDQNIHFDEMSNLLGRDLAQRIKNISITLYQEAAIYALKRGLIIADTKFEFGIGDDDDLFLIDEALTPDSSRFWDIDQYQIGSSPPSLDKQYVRDYLESVNWDKTAPGPRLPSEIIHQTRAKYIEVQQRLMV